MIPNVVSWTHEPPCWIHHSSHQFPEAWSASLFLSCKTLPPPLELPTFSSRFCIVFFIFSIFQIDGMNASQPSSIIELWLLVCRVLLFSLLSGLSNFAPNFRPHILRSGSCLNFCQSPLPNHSYLLGGFSFNKVNFVNPFQESDKLRFVSTFQQSLILCSCNTSRFVWVALVTSMSFSGIGNVSFFGP